MSAEVLVSIEDPDEALDTYESIKLYRDTDPAGDFSTLIATETLVADTYSYVIEDSTGGSGYVYRFRLYHSTGPVESDFSPPIFPGVSLQWLRIEAAIRAHAGFRGTATGGSATQLVDEVLRDNGVDENFLAGAWIYRPDADESSDKLRRGKAQPFDEDTGAWLPVRSWTNAPEVGEAYEVFNLAPPTPQAGAAYSWSNAVRDGLQRIRYVDMLFLGAGDGSTRRFSLDTFGNRLNDRGIRRVILRRTYTDGSIEDEDCALNGRWWEIAENTPNALTLVLSHAPQTDQVVIVEAHVTDAALYRDDDTTMVPSERAIRAAVVAMYESLDMRSPGRYAGELTRAILQFNEMEQAEAPSTFVRL